MPWPVWEKDAEEVQKTSSATLHVQSPLKRSSIPDTVDSFKLEPSKIRHGSNTGNKTVRDFGFSLRQSHLNIPTRISPFGSRRGNSVTGIHFEPKSITEYKRLRYITNRDIHRKLSVVHNNLLGGKSGSHDKHCMFVSVTGITVKLNLGQRRPVEASYGSRLTWSGLRKRGDRVPHYASTVSYISIHMSDATLMGSPNRRTVTNDVAFYMSKDDSDKKTKTDSPPDAQTLRRSLELQVKTLDNHFSSRPSIDTLSSIGPKLSFLWDEMGLSLQPLSSTATSLYEVLTKDKVQLKKGVPAQVKEKPLQSKKLSDKKSPKIKAKAKTPLQGDKRSSSLKLNHSNLREPIKNMNLRTKQSHFLSSKKDGKTLQAKINSQQSPMPDKKNQLSQIAGKGSETSTTDYSVSTEESKFSTISGGNQTARATTIREKSSDSLGYSQAKEVKTLDTEQSNLKKLNQTRDWLLSKDSETTVPKTSRQSVQYDALLSKTPAHSASNKQQVGASSMPEEKPDYFTQSQVRGLETLQDEESFQKMLQTKAHSDLQRKIKSEKQPLLHEETPLFLLKSQAQSLEEMETKENYQNILKGSKPKIKSEKQPSMSSSFSDFRSPTSSRTSWDYNFAFHSRTPSDYKSVITTRSTSLSNLESHMPSERPIQSEKEIFIEKLQIPHAMTTKNENFKEEKFYDCLSLEEKRSSLLAEVDTRSRVRRYFSSLSASTRRAVRWIAKQVFRHNDRNNEISSVDDANDHSNTIYFSPWGSSHKELNNISNSNSASQTWLLYWELWQAQLELKELWAENIKLQLKLRQEMTLNMQRGCFTRPMSNPHFSIKLYQLKHMIVNIFPKPFK